VLTGTAVPAGVRVIVFGDVATDIRASRAARLAGLGIDAAFPLWGMDTRHLARLILEAGIKAVITRVDPRAVAVSWLGRCFGTNLVAELHEAVDPCGEHGEFHTFTSDGPGFGHAIPVVLEGVRWHGGTVYAELAEASATASCDRRPA
jgi:diphthamide synthase (EF-2-diphthine--ammonia ligase)